MKSTYSAYFTDSHFLQRSCYAFARNFENTTQISFLAATGIAVNCNKEKLKTFWKKEFDKNNKAGLLQFTEGNVVVTSSQNTAELTCPPGKEVYIELCNGLKLSGYMVTVMCRKFDPAPAVMTCDKKGYLWESYAIKWIYCKGGYTWVFG